MAEHTPGPWEFNQDFNEITHDDTLVALPATSGGLMFDNRAVTPPEEDEWLANAALIAAAPALVAALSGLLAWAESDAVEIPLAHQHPLDCGCGEILESARAALALARGGQP